MLDDPGSMSFSGFIYTHENIMCQNLQIMLESFLKYLFFFSKKFKTLISYWSLSIFSIRIKAIHYRTSSYAMTTIPYE